MGGPLVIREDILYQQLDATKVRGIAFQGMLNSCSEKRESGCEGLEGASSLQSVVVDTRVSGSDVKRLDPTAFRKPSCGCAWLGTILAEY